jgi:hypothetical protein
MSITPYSYGNFPEYRFYISTLSSTSYEAFPLNFLASRLVDTLEDNNIFYRRKFTGTLIFGSNSRVLDVFGVTQNRKDDYILFRDFETSEPCTKLYLTIIKTIGGVSTTYYEGYFSTSDGNFDHDNCTFETSILTEDDYTDLLKEADTEYNILTLTPVITTAIQGSINVAFTRNRYIYNDSIAPAPTDNVLEFLAQQVLPGATISSTFFSNATNPVTLTTNHLKLLTIAQKSDIIRPTSSDAATTAMMSWNGLMEILWGMFQVKWDYDSATNTINVEHISWWGKTAGEDLSTQLLAKSTNKHRYEKELMPKYEKFSFMEASDSNFIGQPIWYDSYCVNQEPKSNVVETSISVTTDLVYIISTPNAIADDGFVILCNYWNAALYVRITAGAYHGAYLGSILLNMDLSWANLHNAFYRHNRVLINGYMNGSITNFWTSQKNIIQECNAIICDPDYNPNNYITTELGEVHFNGEKATVKSSELSPSAAMKFILAYGSPDNTNTGVPDIKYVFIVESGCGKFTATFSEAPTVDYTIHILHIIYDSSRVEVCNGGAGADWVIDHTNPGVEYDLSLCGAIPAGGYIYYPVFSITGLLADGWQVGLINDANCVD